uniref:hypothetical protein n=1 Tax=Sphingomonas populi TaxID=2484750 RepID=UPI0013EE7ED4|nr:hypothetical protein [Sphingomonas populi]
MPANPGYCPAEAAGKRVDVLLANGSRRQWPADGKQGCCWTIRGIPADIREYEVVR